MFYLNILLLLIQLIALLRIKDVLMVEKIVSPTSLIRNIPILVKQLKALVQFGVNSAIKEVKFSEIDSVFDIELVGMKQIKSITVSPNIIKNPKVKNVK